jgi:hypothetical protein
VYGPEFLLGFVLVLEFDQFGDVQVLPVNIDLQRDFRDILVIEAERLDAFAFGPFAKMLVALLDPVGEHLGLFRGPLIDFGVFVRGVHEASSSIRRGFTWRR